VILFSFYLPGSWTFLSEVRVTAGLHSNSVLFAHLDVLSAPESLSSCSAWILEQLYTYCIA